MSFEINLMDLATIKYNTHPIPLSSMVFPLLISLKMFSFTPLLVIALRETNYYKTYAKKSFFSVDAVIFIGSYIYI